MKTHYCLKPTLLFLFLFVSFPSFSQFGEKQVIHAESFQRKFILADDFDNDGDNEVVFFEVEGGWEDPTYHYYIMINDGGTYTQKLIKSDKNQFIKLTATDLNNDGLKDLAVVQAENDKIGYLRMDTNFNFSWRRNAVEGLAQKELNGLGAKYIDLTNDGFPDIVTTQGQENRLVYLQNLQDETYAEASLIVETGSSEFVFLDVENDNDTDIGIIKGGVGSSNFTFEIYANDGNGNFTLFQSFTYDFIFYNINNFEFEDINNDGLKDLIFTDGFSCGGASNIWYHAQLNDGSFSQEHSFLIEADIFELSINGYIKNFAISDVDNDGDKDFLVTIESEDCSDYGLFSYEFGWVENKELGNSVEYHLLENHVDGIFQDIDSDGKIDLLLTNSNSYYIRNTDHDFVWLKNIDLKEREFEYRDIGGISIGRMADILISDLNEDGTPEIFSAHDQKIVKYDAPFTKYKLSKEIIRYTDADNGFNSLWLENIDQDANKEFMFFNHGIVLFNLISIYEYSNEKNTLLL
ncbi:FG-GAP repeat domain-containing protein [Catalinimonas niigatensis]|uniref:FG-GAP repeat domain-containing protein n=1 Tax=Catalinimonas niigatensis TaxID=1397264 RepID=UPI002665F0BC|nr:VCBS repeat-containing protein [Catalinimonas niigatensis]WPP52740.1 VCBS repeat-containing protein [Catalinimonas niigatensis]